MTNKDMALAIFEMCKVAKDKAKAVRMVETLLDSVADDTFRETVNQVVSEIKTLKRWRD